MLFGSPEFEKFTTEVALRAIDTIIDRGGRLMKDYWAKYRSRDSSVYAKYLNAKSPRANSVRNLIYSMRSIPLYDIYVSTMITDGALTGDQLIELLCNSENKSERRSAPLAVVGQAGTGKSLFMKHAFFAIQQIDKARIPILIEVSAFNRAKPDSLERKIFEEIASFVDAVTPEQVAHAVRGGLFVLLLDGVDELRRSLRSHYEAEVSKFLSMFPSCPMLVSSRPDQRLLSLFDVRRIAPLGLPAAKDLVKRLPFDEDVMGAFIALLPGLFRSHQEFVSVPLLCTIMLLTFSATGHVADNRHEFFEDAFGALWSKHDGLKPGFERPRYTGLQKGDFVRLLSAFAISSYRSGDLNMRDSQVRRHFRVASRLSGVACKEGDFLKDLTESTSLAIQDGPYLRFCHLSFQEYFSAVFVCETDDSTVGRLIDDLSDSLETSNVLPLALSMHDEKIERHWVLPRVREMLPEIEATKGEDHAYARLALGEAETAPGNYPDAMHKIRLLYGLQPDTYALRTAYDAALGMGISLRQLTGRSAARTLGIFEKDRRNFAALAGRLEEKYSKRSSALLELLAQGDSSQRATPP